MSSWRRALGMRPRRRCPRKANPEALNKAGYAAHVHVERIAGPQGGESLRIGGAAGQFCPQFAEIVLESSRRYDFQDPGGTIPGIPKRVPLFAWLEDQISRMTDHDGVSEQRPDAALEDKAVLVFAMVPMHGRSQRSRLHRMFYKGDTLASIIPFDHEPGACAPKKCMMPSCGPSILGAAIVSFFQPRPTARRHVC